MAAHAAMRIPGSRNQRPLAVAEAVTRQLRALGLEHDRAGPLEKGVDLAQELCELVYVEKTS